MDTSTAWNELFRIGAARWGVVTTGDARRVGIAASSFDDRRRREQWHRFSRCVALLPGFPITLAARRSAALLTCGRRATLSHVTALTLHGLDARIETQGMIDVLIPHDRVMRSPTGVHIHRSRRLGAVDRTLVNTLPVTTVARTLVDLAGQLPVWRVEGLALHARQRDLLKAPDLRAQAGRRSNIRGLGKVRHACDVLEDDGADSILERRTRVLLQAHGLTPTDRPHPVACRAATLWVDMAFPEARVAVECDGRTFHSSDRAFERDRRRWNQLRAAHWDIVWITWNRLHSDPQGVVAEVRRAVVGSRRQRQVGDSPSPATRGG